MSRACGIDLGDQWVGIALSDPSMILARPHEAVAREALFAYLKVFFAEHEISVVIVGLPRTMRGTESDQTRSVRETFEQLKTTFEGMSWMLWDERLSSKRAESICSKRTLAHGSARDRESEKNRAQACAAAFILDSYLSSRSFC